MSAVNLNASSPVNFVNHAIPAEQNVFPFHLENHTDELIHLAIYDYEKWVFSGNDADDGILFSIDKSTDCVQFAQGNLSSNEKSLYLIRAYFESGGIELIIEKSEDAATLNLEIVSQGLFSPFEHNHTYRVLDFRKIDKPLHSDGMQF